MILEAFGVLAAGLDLTDADEISDVVLTAAIDYTQLTDLWWVVDCEIAAATAGTIKFELVIATAANLNTAIQVCCVDIAAITDVRVATAGKRIASFNIGNMLVDMLTTAGSDYPYVGMKNTLSTSTTISINASLSTAKPPTMPDQQVVQSNVSVPT